ncbi:MAG: chorismate mutase [Spirochaetaceae bacterium]|jgi:chorismate mutase|nr:chorismate mutase [Spirochaetaceae bacterium]
MKKLFALRGAVCCENTDTGIRDAVCSMYGKLLDANKLCEADIVSLVFSVTPDLDAKNPCAALREGGYAGETALFAAQEARSAGMPNGIIRALLHCYLDDGAKPVHIYTGGAEKLRPDRKG